MILSNARLNLEIPADVSMVPMVQGFVDSGAPVLGLDPNKTIRLSMASEELLCHLSACAPMAQVHIHLERKGPRISLTFGFDSNLSDLWAMNLTSSGEISLDEDQDMSRMGLLLASRMVDGFGITVKRQRADVTLYQDLNYPEIEKISLPPPPLRGALKVDSAPGAPEVTQACGMVLAVCSRELYPTLFKTPGKLIDLMDDNQFHTAIARDEAGTMAGMVCWKALAGKSVEFYGPYIFHEGPGNTPRLLMDELISGVARTPAMILYSRMATGHLPPGSFEPLATLEYRRPGVDMEKRTLWFRHLREDMGCRVWAHPVFSAFLNDTYERLVMVRTIQEYRDQGASRPHRSLFGVHLNTDLKEASIQPMLDGYDLEENIRRHREMLCKEGFPSIFFFIDLSRGWQAAMGEALVNQGFTPAYVLPYSGESDKVIFHHAAITA